MSEDYERGQREGLRLALTILATEEAKWSERLGQSRSYRTNVTREVRHKTLQVAQSRIQTALNRLMPKDQMIARDEIGAALKRAGL